MLRNGGMYRNRWGDALLRRISMELDGTAARPLPADDVARGEAMLPLSSGHPSLAAGLREVEVGLGRLLHLPRHRRGGVLGKRPHGAGADQ